jgi:Ca2+-transporting ATPase
MLPIIVTVFAVESGFLQNFLMTTSPTGGQWLACLGRSLIIPIVVQAEKAIRRRCHHYSEPPAPTTAPAVVDPHRAR